MSPLTSTSLPVSRLINVSVSLAPSAAQGQNLNMLLIIGSSTIIDVVTRMRSYNTLAQVASDFGTSAPEYLAAVLYFEQNPQPTQLLIGRWAQAASSGQLYGAALAANILATLQAVTTGSFTITINGGSAQNITGLNFSAITNLNGAATVINAVLTGATVAYDSVNNRFVVTSSTTGATSTVSFATAEGTGTDVSNTLGLRSTDSGAYLASGIAAESALTAVTTLDTMFGQQWYGLVVLGAADADHEAIAPYIEGANNYHFYGVTTQEAGVLLSSSTTDIAAILSATGFTRTAVQYSSQNSAAVVSLLGRILPTGWQGNATTINLMYQQEPGITPETLNTTQIGVLESKNCNVFVAYNILSSTGGNVAIIERGYTTAGIPIDTVIGAAAFAVTLQTAGFNVNFTSTTKIPQTDPGVHQYVVAFESVCDQFVTNGFLAPGLWQSAPFGPIATNQTLPKGYFIYVPPIATQSAASRNLRVTPPIQIAAKLAGAVDTVNLAVTVNS